MYAIFGTTARNIVTIIGDPSYISGTHIWKGVAPSLNNRPSFINVVDNVASDPVSISILVAPVVA